MTRKRKHFSKQFKIDGVKPVTEQRCNFSEAARNIGIHHSSLRRWKKQLETNGNHAFPDFELIAKVRQIHSDTRGSHGSRRMSGRLRDDGYDVGRCRAGSLMKKAGVSVKRRKRFKKTTDSNHNHPVAPNLLNRQFEALNVRYCLVCRYNLFADPSGPFISGCCSWTCTPVK